MSNTKKHLELLGHRVRDRVSGLEGGGNLGLL